MRIADELLNLLYVANREFLRNNMDNILRGVAERNLCAALMYELKILLKNTEFDKYYVDVEYNRNFNGVKTIRNDSYEVIPITCDLIIHSRGENLLQDNLLALEMKKNTASEDEKIKDRKRLQILTKESYDGVWSNDGTELPRYICGYIVGVYYEIDNSNKQISTEVFHKGQLMRKSIDSFNDCLNYEQKFL